MSTLSVHLDDQTEEALKAMAALTHQSIEDVVKNAIADFMRKELDALDDERRYQDYLENGGINSQQVLAWLDHWANGKRSPCPQ